MKKVIVTGGLGFIGSHLVSLLLRKGVHVVIIDNKATNVVEKSFFSNNNYQIFHQSIQKVNLSKIKDVDNVFHLASILGPTGVLSHGGNIGMSIVNDTVSLRDYCIQKGATLIDISTSEIYGHEGLLKENSKKLFPGLYTIRSEYAGAKMLAEMSIINKSLLDKKLKFHIIRPFNVSGPLQKPDGGFVIPRFVIAALTNQPLTVYGNGNQRRAFGHVEDICDAILKIATSRFKNQIWNIGNPKNEMSIKDLAKLVRDAIKATRHGRTSKIIYVEPKKIHGRNFSEATDKIPYIKKINKLLRWKPKKSTLEIVKDVIKFYEKKIDNGYYYKVI